jgi:hypothetical protein
MRHPTQPLAADDGGIVRFKENQIVRKLLDRSREGLKTDLNDIACMEFPQEDRQQFAQLIGYSLSGYGELSYVDDAAYHVASELAESAGKDEKDARIEFLESRLSDFKKAIREPIATLFDVHPSDLGSED